MKPQQKGLMIAAPGSGSGKTVITLALLRALKKRGLDICAAKAGPDYIDPAFHTMACGMPSVNLDPWAMTPARYLQLANGQGGSHLLVESMMGLFDGAADGTGSGAELAKNLDIPVVLVVDAAKQSHSIAALVRGFRDHDDGVAICGVILNKVGSARHETMLRQALDEIRMPVIGVIGRSGDLELPERHLGLVQAVENTNIEKFIDLAANCISATCDMEMLMDCFGAIDKGNDQGASAIDPPGQNIHVAHDAAFSFIYPHLLHDWRMQGANVTFFSPLEDEGPGKKADAVFLPGGYPELHADKIAASDKFRQKMFAANSRGALIYGECGGYMVLGNAIIDTEGQHHRMLGMLDLETSFQNRKLHLGYRLARAQGEFFAGRTINAHEFHYTSAIKEAGDPLFTAQDATGEYLGPMGLRAGSVMGSYLHLIDVKEN